MLASNRFDSGHIARTHQYQWNECVCAYVCVCHTIWQAVWTMCACMDANGDDHLCCVLLDISVVKMVVGRLSTTLVCQRVCLHGRWCGEFTLPIITHMQIHHSLLEINAIWIYRWYSVHGNGQRHPKKLWILKRKGQKRGVKNVFASVNDCIHSGCSSFFCRPDRDTIEFATILLFLSFPVDVASIDLIRFTFFS